MTKRPYVGAMVQYKYRANDVERAAVITRVHDDQWVSLHVFEPGGTDQYPSHVEYGIERGWRWIPDNAGTMPQTWDGI